MGHPTWRTTAGALLLALPLAAGLGACGGSSGGSAGSPPTDASQASFCKTFTGLGADTTPKQAATTLGRVGTPSNIGSAQRRGFVVLVQHLRQLPDAANNEALTRMTQGLKASDQADVRAFLTYYADECPG